MSVLVLLSKPDCHLCHRMDETVQRVLPDFEAALLTRDVREDADLERRYALDIPVLLLGETEVARHRVSDEQLRQRLRALGVPPRRA